MTRLPQTARSSRIQPGRTAVDLPVQGEQAQREAGPHPGEHDQEDADKYVQRLHARRQGLLIPEEQAGPIPDRGVQEELAGQQTGLHHSSSGPTVHRPQSRGNTRNRAPDWRL